MHGLQQPVLYLIVLSCIGCATVPPAAPAPVAPPNSAAVGNNYIVAIAPPPVAKGTIWDFLGVKALCQEIGMVANCGLNLLGSRFPGLEPGPLLSAIGDPANAKSTNPAVAAAAAAKADEDAAPQKVKALRYLGTLGCGGCYPDVESALLAALDDCTEVVRFEAASVLAETSRNRCRYCDSSKCCSPKVRKKLEKIAIGLNDKGCHVEPSARVRRIARVALCNCGCDEFECGSDDGSHGPMEAPIEGPSSDENIPPKPSAAMRESKQQHATFQNPVETAIFESQHPPDQGPSGVSSSEDRSVVDHVAASTVQQVPFQPVESEPLTSRIRWEAASVTVYHFDSKSHAKSVIEFVRKKAIGLDSPAPPESDLKFVTARQMGWARPQDIRSKELARMLFELPIGQISPVIEVGNQLMVCRVLEKSSAKPPVTESTQNTGGNRDLNMMIEQATNRP